MKDIAKALNLSTGTVDRALHAKPGINPMTRARVLQMAESLGYRPNLAARYLKSRRTLHVSVHLPQEIALFWDALRDGIREAAAPFAPALHVDFRRYPRLGEGDVALFEEAIRDKANGIIIAPGNPAALRSSMRKAARRQIPVICVVTDAPDTQRLTAVSADPFTVGAVAAELLSRWVPAGGRVAFFTGSLGIQDHAQKWQGFEESLKASRRRLTLTPVMETHDDPQEGFRRAVRLLRKTDDLRGIFVSTVNSLPVLQAAKQEGKLPNLTIVTTDLFPELVDWIREGGVAATLYQRPVTQGRIALQAMYQYLLDGTYPAPRLSVTPHIVMRSNLHLFLDRLTLDEDGATRSPLVTGTL
jgi:LacI family transcriptional regulator